MGEIADCISYQTSIRNRKKALLESKVTSESIGVVAFKQCPCCNTKISAIVDEDTCPLCKTEYPTERVSSPYLHVLTELDFQEKQNSKVFENLRTQLSTEKTGQQINTQELNAKKALLRSIAGALSKQEHALIEASRKMGFAESQVATLREKIDIIQKVDDLREQKRSLNEQIGWLNQLIEGLTAASAERRRRVFSGITNLALKILEQDEKYEEVFQHATEMDAEIDFAKDRWLIDGRSKFSGSSNFFKKNALHTAMLAYSIADPKCRHPRFLILDDIENGGMTAPRSQNFQRILASILAGKENDCQVIISTAMVDPSLDNETYGVGPAYKKGEYVIQLK